MDEATAQFLAELGRFLSDKPGARVMVLVEFGVREFQFAATEGSLCWQLGVLQVGDKFIRDHHDAISGIMSEQIAGGEKKPKTVEVDDEEDEIDPHERPN